MMGRCVLLAALLLAALLLAPVCRAQDTAFTYQGSLHESGATADGLYDMAFSLWDQAVLGDVIGGPLVFEDVEVVGGLFVVELDFGAAVVDKTARWLEVEVAGQTLSPRQQLTAAPMSINTRGIHVSDDGGFVGVGRESTITPAEKFGVRSDAGDGQYGGMYVETAGEGLPFYGYATGGIARVWHYFDAASGEWRLNYGGDRMRMTSDGNVAIGGEFPDGRLHVEVEESSRLQTALWIEHNRTSGAQNRGVHARVTGGTTPIALYGTTGLTPFGVAVWGTSSGTSSIGVRGSSLTDSGVGYGVYGGCASPSGYDFFAAGAGINYGSSSSRRWKDNVEPIGGALGILDRIRGVRFDWDTAHGGHRDIGFIAEEVGEVLPEIVVYEENGVDAEGMDYSKVGPVLVEAIKELRAEKDAEIETLEARVAQLEALVARLVQQQNGVHR